MENEEEKEEKEGTRLGSRILSMSLDWGIHGQYGGTNPAATGGGRDWCRYHASAKYLFPRLVPASWRPDSTTSQLC
jgi:hypothetical protein